MSEPEQLDLLDWLAMQPPGLPPTAPELAPAFAGQSSDPVPVFLRRVDPSCNMRRFYSLALATSLFGECGVVRQWGRLGSEGQSRTEWYVAKSGAESALQVLLRAKRRRGYTT
jgi:predicted DNA-binding WGR domain protein